MRTIYIYTWRQSRSIALVRLRAFCKSWIRLVNAYVLTENIRMIRYHINYWFFWHRQLISMLTIYTNTFDIFVGSSLGVFVPENVFRLFDTSFWICVPILFRIITDSGNGFRNSPAIFRAWQVSQSTFDTRLSKSSNYMSCRKN